MKFLSNLNYDRIIFREMGIRTTALWDGYLIIIGVMNIKQWQIVNEWNNVTTYPNQIAIIT